ncbi:hypothetical protein AHAS_Ahas18G0037800 [Arachis hypogaea]
MWTPLVKYNEQQSSKLQALVWAVGPLKKRSSRQEGAQWWVEYFAGECDSLEALQTPSPSSLFLSAQTENNESETN